MSAWRHLAGRFFGALRPGGPSPDDEEWVARLLEPGELELWRRQTGHDRRHTVAVARRVEVALAGGPHAGDPRYLAAALLHDVGKLAAGLSIPSRVLATVFARAAGGALGDWEERPGLRRRIALYGRHGELGADMIRLAGGREEAAAWAAAHHDRARLDPLALPASVVAALAAADPD
jgi:HD domain